jgi:hypothetical protein
MSITPSMLMVLLVATSPCLLEVVATFLRLAAVLTVALNRLSEVFLGVVDTPATVSVVISRLYERDTASQQRYSQCGKEQNALATFYPIQHGFLLDNNGAGVSTTNACPTKIDPPVGTVPRRKNRRQARRDEVVPVAPLHLAERR